MASINHPARFASPHRYLQHTRLRCHRSSRLLLKDWRLQFCSIFPPLHCTRSMRLYTILARTNRVAIFSKKSTYLHNCVFDCCLLANLIDRFKICVPAVFKTSQVSPGRDLNPQPNFKQFWIQTCVKCQ